MLRLLAFLFTVASATGRLARRELDAALDRHELVDRIAVSDTSTAVAVPWAPTDDDDAVMPTSLDVSFTLYVRVPPIVCPARSSQGFVSRGGDKWFDITR